MIWFLVSNPALPDDAQVLAAQGHLQLSFAHRHDHFLFSCSLIVKH